MGVSRMSEAGVDRDLVTDGAYRGMGATSESLLRVANPATFCFIARSFTCSTGRGLKTTFNFLV